MKRVIISCMDYRLTDEILKRADKDTLIFRNAGANVKEFLQRLKEIKPDEILYLPRTDCAAMRIVFNVIRKGENISKNVKEKLVDVFSGQKFETLDELEQLNAKINEEMLKKEVTKNVKTELIDVKKIQWPQQKTEVYFYSITARPTDKIGAYILQSTSIDDVKADLEIAKDKLGFKEIYDCSSGDCKRI